MNTKLAVVVMCGALVLAGRVGAMRMKDGQEPPPAKVAAPQLKPEVALKLRDVQYEAAQTLLKMRDLEKQYADLQQKFVGEQQKFAGLAGSALKDSGIDEGKWQLDADTLTVVERKAAGQKEKQ